MSTHQPPSCRHQQGREEMETQMRYVGLPSGEMEDTLDMGASEESGHVWHLESGFLGGSACHGFLAAYGMSAFLI